MLAQLTVKSFVTSSCPASPARRPVHGSQEQLSQVQAASSTLPVGYTCASLYMTSTCSWCILTAVVRVLGARWHLIYSWPLAPRRPRPHPHLFCKNTQASLCEQLLHQGLLSTRAAAAMEAVDRAHYVTTYEGVPGWTGYRVSRTGTATTSSLLAKDAICSDQGCLVHEAPVYLPPNNQQAKAIHH
jgi:hypothetical protein